MGGTPFTATAVRNPQVTQPAPQAPAPKTNVSLSDLKSTLYSTGNYTPAMEADFTKWGAAQGNASFFGGTSPYQSTIDALYNKYATPQAQPQTQAPKPQVQPQVQPQVLPQAPKTPAYTFPTQTYNPGPTLEDLSDPLQGKGLDQTVLTRPQEMQLPSFLSDLIGGDNLQRRTAIATKGVYGGFNNDDSRKYFLNSLLREYLGSDNKPTGYDLMPVEEQYLQTLGIPATDSIGSEDFLRELARYYMQ
jgi:hypothetical protein